MIGHEGQCLTSWSADPNLLQRVVHKALSCVLDRLECRRARRVDLQDDGRKPAQKRDICATTCGTPSCSRITQGPDSFKRRRIHTRLQLKLAHAVGFQVLPPIELNVVRLEWAFSGAFGERRVQISAFLCQPVLPRLRMVWPLLHIDAPGGRGRIKEIPFAFFGGEATGDGGLGLINQILCGAEDRPKPSGGVI
jgi:hypothetical protein